MEGGWVVYDYDVVAYPIAIFSDELEAHRFRKNLGYGYVRFWSFGTEWMNQVVTVD